jgi:hypothetical protein
VVTRTGWNRSFLTLLHPFPPHTHTHLTQPPAPPSRRRPPGSIPAATAAAATTGPAAAGGARPLQHARARALRVRAVRGGDRAEPSGPLAAAPGKVRCVLKPLDCGRSSFGCGECTVHAYALLNNVLYVSIDKTTTRIHINVHTHADTRGRGYFTGCAEGRTLECAVQGRFKRRLRFDEVGWFLFFWFFFGGGRFRFGCGLADLGSWGFGYIGCGLFMYGVLWWFQ